MTAFEALKALYLAENLRKYPALPYRTIPKYTDRTSNGLTRCILDFLRLSEHQAERVNNTGRLIDRRQIVSDVLGNRRMIGSATWIPGTGTRGTADISATINGLSVKIEVKCSATGDRIRPAQREYEKQIQRAGGLYFIARTFPEFYQWYLQTFSQEASHARK